MNDAILNRVLGVVLTFTRTGTAIKIVPPLDCHLTGEVDQATGTIKPVKKLVVKAHVVALVANHADLNAPSKPALCADTAWSDAMGVGAVIGRFE